MKRVVIIASVLMMCVTASGQLLLLEPGYRCEVYGSYSIESLGTPHCATFDGDGNLYVTHLGSSRYSNDGAVYRIAADGSGGVFASGMYYPRGIVYTGGSVYGDALYVADTGRSAGGEIVRIDLSGALEHFAEPRNQPGSIALDRTGNYSGLLYTGTLGLDHIDSIDAWGSVSLFSAFPYNSQGGGPYGMAFDEGGEYGGLMYVATTSTEAPQWSGLFAVTTTGDATRFIGDLGAAAWLAFDPGDLLDGSLFIVGQEDILDPWSLWRISPDGTASEFAQTTLSAPVGLTFGPDGGMYLIEYADQTATVYRVVPEPCTVVLLSLGAMTLRRRR